MSITVELGDPSVFTYDNQRIDSDMAYDLYKTGIPIRKKSNLLDTLPLEIEEYIKLYRPPHRGVVKNYINLLKKFNKTWDKYMKEYNTDIDSRDSEFNFWTAYESLSNFIDNYYQENGHYYLYDIPINSAVEIVNLTKNKDVWRNDNWPDLHYLIV